MKDAGNFKNLERGANIYSSLLNNCADGINVQAGKYPKFNNSTDCNKCAGWNISYRY